MLEADRGAEQSLRRVRAFAGDGGAVLDQAFHAAQAGGADENAHLRRDGERGFASAFHFEREHAAERAHLPRAISWPGCDGRPG